jgi:hypothetical protein
MIVGFSMVIAWLVYLGRLDLAMPTNVAPTHEASSDREFEVI